MQRIKENHSSTVNERVSISGLRQSLKIFRFILPYKWHFVSGLIFLLFSTATVTVFPVVIRHLVDVAVEETDVNSKLFNLGLLLGGVLLVQSVFSFFRIYFFSIVSEKGMAAIRTALYEKVICMPITFFEKRPGIR